MTEAAPHLIAVDWGTSSFRAYLVGDAGASLERIETPGGILSIGGADFAGALRRHLAPWLSLHGPIPVQMSGMIGSRQGWIEAPYVACPAGLTGLSRGLVDIAAEGLPPIKLVPGLVTHNALGMPDVMRGEETQIFGAMAQLGIEDGLFVLPGTHAKWVTVRNGQIAGFETYMTGEVFAALKDHTILGRLMKPQANAVAGIAASFRRGVEAGAQPGHPGSLLHRMFSTRTLGLTGGLADEQAADYLSGLLIGSELGAATKGDAGGFVIIAGTGLSGRYLEAAHILGLDAAAAPADCVVAGHEAIARVSREIQGASR